MSILEWLRECEGHWYQLKSVSEVLGIAICWNEAWREIANLWLLTPNPNLIRISRFHL
ncbi:uncharacterized protein G2W53_043257 [Senna tora]|uniref:Uncharacterized protein n=1 Tax=Senna tora TaxID=362788 RepID=A0A834SIK8_9FABA|nr:uncharacterized protein G2W53_043257 [Senna tora]